MDKTKIIIIGMGAEAFSVGKQREYPQIFNPERGLELDAIFIDEAKDLQGIRDQISAHLGREFSIQEVGQMIERLNEPEIASRSLQDLSLDLNKEIELTAREFQDLKYYDPPKNHLFNEPPRQKKDRNRPDKITLARMKKRKKR